MGCIIVSCREDGVDGGESGGDDLMPFHRV